ncbi:MAG: type III-B CRISPR-associated protein Cas10/Cmr2 [Cyanobacteriota bacterium]|nr:type III-B CRISPR-associated protein Cas10/Cmr2 [Cyanobacteriota bacterium]
MTYTAVTFAPVQSFIRSSRKLRDVYGSSLLLSHLARALHDDATAKVSAAGGSVISPADVKSTRGVPNTLLILGSYHKGDAQQAMQRAWHQVLHACREWLEDLPCKQLANDARPWPPASWGNKEWEEGWGASWNAVERHSWELFHGQGTTIASAEEALGFAKQQRAWEVPNWTGESSTLSSVEAIVRPGMARTFDPFRPASATCRQEARDFLQVLCHPKNLGEAFAGDREEISLTELVKRLVTYGQVAPKAFDCDRATIHEILPERFESLSGRMASSAAKRPETVIWFMADGDEVGNHIRSFRQNATEDPAKEASARSAFSRAMRNWAAELYAKVPESMGADRATVVYAGGDDVLGALHESEPGCRDLCADHLMQWLRLFPVLWNQAKQPITASMGVVWADSSVPQREALQHTRDAEASAKARGRDRFALRLIYASGNHLEWTCPWTWLDPILMAYRDREGRAYASASAAKPPRWRHLAEDLLWLKERHAIGDGAPGDAAIQVAEGLLNAYFPGWFPPAPPEQGNPSRRLDHWLLDLGRVMAGLERWRATNEAVAR